MRHVFIYKIRFRHSHLYWLGSFEVIFIYGYIVAKNRPQISHRSLVLLLKHINEYLCSHPLFRFLKRTANVDACECTPYLLHSRYQRQIFMLRRHVYVRQYSTKLLSGTWQIIISRKGQKPMWKSTSIILKQVALLTWRVRIKGISEKATGCCFSLMARILSFHLLILKLAFKRINLLVRFVEGEWTW